MKIKSIIKTGLKLTALTLIMFMGFVAASVVTGQASAEQDSQAFLMLIFVCLINTLALSYVVIRSRWTGFKLMTAVFFVLFGVMTFMTQIETAFFITNLPKEALPNIFLMGFIVSAIFSPLAVLVLGKRRAKDLEETENVRLKMPIYDWLWKLSLISIVYVVVYFSFGYFIAWQIPAVQQYYGGTDPGSFVAQIKSVINDNPGLIPFQVLRGILWTLIALPVIYMSKGKRWETGLMTGLLFSVLMAAQLLLPNPYMPEPVRIAHLKEVGSSNLIFGFLVVWILTLNTMDNNKSK